MRLNVCFIMSNILFLFGTHAVEGELLSSFKSPRNVSRSHKNGRKLGNNDEHSSGRCTFKDAYECFRGLNVLILGTSVSRHYYFALTHILSRNHTVNNPDDFFVDVLEKGMASWDKQILSTYRENEKMKCGSSKHTIGCSSLIAESDTFLSFSWFVPFFQSQNDDDNTVSSFANNIKENTRSGSTYVLVNGGLENAMKLADFHAVPESDEIAVRFPHIVQDFKPIFDINGNVCWRLSTQLCCQANRNVPFWTDEEPCLNRHGTNMTIAQNYLVKSNSEIEALILKNNMKYEMAPDGSETPGKMDVFDTFKLTDHSKCNKYEDFVHAPILAYEQIEAWMLGNLKCKCGGH